MREKKDFAAAGAVVPIVFIVDVVDVVVDEVQGEAALVAIDLARSR